MLGKYVFTLFNNEKDLSLTAIVARKTSISFKLVMNNGDFLQVVKPPWILTFRFIFRFINASITNHWSNYFRDRRQFHLIFYSSLWPLSWKPSPISPITASLKLHHIYLGRILPVMHQSFLSKETLIKTCCHTPCKHETLFQNWKQPYNGKMYFN